MRCLTVAVAVAVAVIALGGADAARASDLTGTPYTVLWRGAGFAQAGADPRSPFGRAAPLPPASAMLRVVDVAARRELARATFDARLRGWLFQMPFAGIDARAGRCLALVDQRNQFIPVRPPSAVDGGLSFRNPLWERELDRVAELAALRREQATVQAQVQTVAGDVARLSAEVGLPVGASAEQCPLPPAPEDPPRPAGALEPAQVAPVAGPVCAWRWERDHGGRVSLERLFADAGLDADWRARAEAATVAAALPAFRLPIAPVDLSLVLDAAAKGRTFLEHADGVRVLARAHAACREEVGRQAGVVRQRWLQAVDEARQAPQRARLQCAQKVEQMARLQAAQAAAPALLAALERQIAQLSAPPPDDNPMALAAQACQP